MSQPKMFRVKRKLRFADCDPAGIGFYPRLLEAVNNTVEDWFDAELGFSFREMHLATDSGVPTRTLSVEFHSPAQLGEVLEWRLQVKKLGRSSIALMVDAVHGDGTLVLQAAPVLIWCDYSGAAPKSVPIPAPIRAQMTRFEMPQ